MVRWCNLRNPMANTHTHIRMTIFQYCIYIHHKMKKKKRHCMKEVWCICL